MYLEGRMKTTKDLSLEDECTDWVYNWVPSKYKPEQDKFDVILTVHRR